MSVHNIFPIVCNNSMLTLTVLQKSTKFFFWKIKFKSKTNNLPCTAETDEEKFYLKLMLRASLFPLRLSSSTKHPIDVLDVLTVPNRL